MKYEIIPRLILLAYSIEISAARIGCYRCISQNGSDRSCEDPFDGSDSSYVKYCQGSKRHRGGMYPASHCIKIYGHDLITDEAITVRECSADDVGNYKGTFQLNGRDVSGMVSSCRVYGCNRGAPSDRRSPVGHGLSVFGAIVLAAVEIYRRWL